MSQKRYYMVEKKATDLATSFLMTPTGIITSVALIIVLLITSVIFASWALPTFLEQLMNPLVWGIGIFIGIMTVASKKGELTIALSLLAGFAFWVVPTYNSLQGIQQSWWANIPLIGDLFATGATAFNIPFIIVSFIIYFLSFFVTSYASAYIIGSFSK